MTTTTSTTSLSDLLRWGKGHRAGAVLLVAVLTTAGIAVGVAGSLFWRRSATPQAPGAMTMPKATDTTAASAPAGDRPKPVVRVQITPERQQLIGMRTAVVGQAAPEATIRTVGALAYDETKVTELHAKAAGWVEKVNVDFVGKSVRKGEPLLSLYSPDLVAAQLDYLVAIKAGAKQAQNNSPAHRLDHSLVEASRTRLKLLDLTDAQIETLERTEQAAKTITLYSPFAGVVTERKAFAGQYITPDMATVKIADLSTIWAIGQVFEYELAKVKVGQAAEVQFPYTETKPVNARVSFIYPDIDPRTRTARVRVEFRNPGVKFKPEAFVTIVLHTGGKAQLSVPREAVIDTGDRQYVLMALADGYFEPRDVTVGEAEGDVIPIFAGLNPGERVVTSGQFLIDSETNLQAAMQSMSATMPGMKMGGADTKGKEQKRGTGKEQPGGGEDMKGMDMSAPSQPKPPERR
jgi:RND family efflux transporter MFP subunit